MDNSKTIQYYSNVSKRFINREEAERLAAFTNKSLHEFLTSWLEDSNYLIRIK